MKNIFLILLSLFAINATAQVKFTLENTKDKTANVIYVGAANTFRVSTPQEISITNITPSQGNIRMNTDGTFSLYVHEASDKPVEIKYTQTKNGAESEVTYPVKYTVKNAPAMLQLKVGEFTSGGIVPLDKMRKNFNISLHGEGFNGNIQNYVISFELFYQPYKKDPSILNYNSSNATSVKAYNNTLSNLQDGDRIFFEKIEITSDDGTSIKQDALNFKLKK